MGYSQKQAADLLEVAQSTCCDWECNTAHPKGENLLKIAQLYELSLNELLNSDKSINIIDSPNAVSVSNSPNAKIETPEAVLKLSESVVELTEQLKEIIKENNNRQ
jgi:transcriptional regulator with XRE-family HTH domain